LAAASEIGNTQGLIRARRRIDLIRLLAVFWWEDLLSIINNINFMNKISQVLNLVFKTFMIPRVLPLPLGHGKWRGAKF